MASTGLDERRGRSFRTLSRSWYLGCCLLDAMRYGRWEDVYALTKIRELDPNILIPEYGITPMHCAAGIEPEEFGLKCTRKLLHIGGDPNITCSEGVTPVHVASCWSRMKVLKILLKKGGDPYLIDGNGKDAFYYSLDKQIIRELIIDIENKKSTKDNGVASCNRLSNTNQTADSVEQESDLNLNSEAYALMIRHRKSVFIFESYPEDDTASSTTLESEVTEDFAYDPKEGMISVSVGETKKNVEYGRCETWTNNSDDEILTENILEADKMHVIQVINNNVNKSLSRGSDVSLKIEGSSQENETSYSPWDRFESFQSHHYDIPITSNKETNLSIMPEKSCPDDIESSISDLKIDKNPENLVKEDNIFDQQTLPDDNIQQSLEFDTNNNKTKLNDYQQDFVHQEALFKATDGGSTNILEVSVSLDSDNSNYSNNEIKHLKKKKSKSSISSLKSASQENNYSTQIESKEFDQFYKMSSLEESVTVHKNFSKLPKKINETLQHFRVNTHYKSRTRMYRLVSKSCDGFKTKESLYCTGFEFWSSKVRSKSDPSSSSRKIIKKS